MKPPNVCEYCGATLPAAALEGLCSRCLLGNVLAEPPTPEEQAAAADEPLFGAPFEEASGTRIGQYKWLEKIGGGGFGEVWAAEQREPVRRRVALKIIKLGMDNHVARRYRSRA